MKHALITLILSVLCGGILMLAGDDVMAQDSAYLREVNFEQARAKDFHRHEAAAEEFDQKREERVDIYKAKIEAQERAQESARRAFVISESQRKKGISDEELDSILRKKLEREAAAEEASRETFVRLRDQVEAAHKRASKDALDENEEYGL